MRSMDMCVERTGTVIAVSADGTGQVDFGDGRPHQVSLVILEVEGEPVAVGDELMVHTGFAVRKIDPAERDGFGAAEA